jgi:hypothetical protein
MGSARPSTPFGASRSRPSPAEASDERAACASVDAQPGGLEVFPRSSQRALHLAAVGSLALMVLLPLQSVTSRRRPGMSLALDGAQHAAALPGASHEVLRPYSTCGPRQPRSDPPRPSTSEDAGCGAAPCVGFASPDYVAPPGFLTLLTPCSGAFRPADLRLRVRRLRVVSCRQHSWGSFPYRAFPSA